MLVSAMGNQPGTLARQGGDRQLKSSTRRPIEWLSVFVLLCASVSAADSTIVCPASATGGATVPIEVTIENEQCTAVNARVISSVVGNANGTLGGLGVYGPQVAASMLTVPVGSAPFCGCGQFFPGFCDCNSNQACTVDSDCDECGNQIPGELVTTIDLAGHSDDR